MHDNILTPFGLQDVIIRSSDGTQFYAAISDSPVLLSIYDAQVPTEPDNAPVAIPLPESYEALLALFAYLHPGAELPDLRAYDYGATRSLYEAARKYQVVGAMQATRQALMFQVRSNPELDASTRTLASKHQDLTLARVITPDEPPSPASTVFVPRPPSSIVFKVPKAETSSAWDDDDKATIREPTTSKGPLSRIGTIAIVFWCLAFLCWLSQGIISGMLYRLAPALGGVVVNTDKKWVERLSCIADVIPPRNACESLRHWSMEASLVAPISTLVFVFLGVCNYELLLKYPLVIGLVSISGWVISAIGTTMLQAQGYCSRPAPGYCPAQGFWLKPTQAMVDHNRAQLVLSYLYVLFIAIAGYCWVSWERSKRQPAARKSTNSEKMNV